MVSMEWSKSFNYDLNDTYSFIKIGFLNYNILDLYKIIIIQDKTLYYDSDLIVIPEKIVPHNNDNDSSIILLPSLIIKDDITSFHFFDYNLKHSIKTIEDFNNEKEFFN
ncbi:hypothetical protein ACTFIY_006433 [Dictyostelium cf. discoideum]